MTEKQDANYAIPYYAVRLKRLFRENARDDLVSLYSSCVGLINAVVRSTLGVSATVLFLAAEFCVKYQKYWVLKKEDQGEAH